MSEQQRTGSDFDGPLVGDLPPSPMLVEDAGIALDEASVATRTPSPWRRAGRRLLRDKPAMFALGFLLLIILVAVFASAIAPHDPADISLDTFLANRFGHYYAQKSETERVAG